MKKLILLSLVLVMTACTSATEAPLAAPTEVLPTSTPIVVVQTVIVEPTQAPTEVPPTPIPPTAEPVVVTVVVEPTQVPPTSAPAAVDANAASGPITVENTLGAGWFTEMTRTRNDFSLRCQLNKVITFSVKPTDKNITEVLFYYRIEDRNTGAAFEWQNAGRMMPDASGTTFTIDFNGEQVNADSRRPNAWLDYQFIGLNKLGQVVGRSEKIERQVTYTFECP